MSNEPSPQQPDYASPPAKQPRLSYPPYTVEIGIATMLLGGFLGGVILPCGGFYYAQRNVDDLGGPLFWPAAMIIGFFAGGLLLPVVTVAIYWLIWRLRR
jgi:hypothetical protein